VLEHHAHCRALLADRDAEVTSRGGGEEVHVLRGERAVESQQRARVRDLLLRAAGVSAAISA